MEMFSRTLDPRHWTNVQNISKALKTKGAANVPKLAVKTWELYDKAWSFPRLRRYNFVMENMDMLEHFQDNLNMNISNEVAMENFLRVANTVHTNLKTKYHDGEFDDPADTDPKVEAEKAGLEAAIRQAEAGLLLKKRSGLFCALLAPLSMNRICC